MIETHELTSLQKMKEEESTYDEARRSTSETLTFCHNHKDEGYAVKFQIADSQLEVELLSLQDFSYYCGTFSIKQKHQQKHDQHMWVNAEVLSDAIRTRFEDVEFKDGAITLNYKQQFSQFKKRYTFPPLEQLQLHSNLFVDIEEAKRMQLKVILANNKFNDLEAQKKILFKELKRLQKQVNEERRLVERLKEKQEQEKLWFKNMVVRCKQQARMLLKVSYNGLCRFKLDTYIFYIFLLILLLILRP